jgi:hypothetical protein
MNLVGYPLFIISQAFVIPSEVEESLETILDATILPMGYEFHGIINALPSAVIRPYFSKSGGSSPALAWRRSAAMQFA